MRQGGYSRIAQAFIRFINSSAVECYKSNSRFAIASAGITLIYKDTIQREPVASMPCKAFLVYARESLDWRVY